MEEIKVSICCITYNHAPYIRECLDGFLMQKCDFNYEILIHDDASTDETAEIIKDYQKKFPDIVKPIFQHENQWSKGVKNIQSKYNFSRAQGKYIALCEGDDYWTDSRKLQKQIDFFKENDEVIFCIHNAVRYIQNKNLYIPFIGSSNFIDKSLIDYELLFERLGGAYATCSAVFKKEMVRELPEYFSLFGVGDTPLLLLAITKGKVGYLKDEMSVYRTTDHNWSSINAIFKNKLINCEQKLNAISVFNAETEYKYNKYIKYYENTLVYQVIFAYCREEKKIIKRFKFLYKYKSSLSFTGYFKAVFRIIVE